MPVTLDLNWNSFKKLPGKPPPLVLQEDSTCPFCYEKEGLELTRINQFQCFDDRGGQNRIVHRVVFCETCGMTYTDPWFTIGGARWLLEKAGASYGHCNPVERVEWVQENVPETKSILDLGCGDGSFLAAFPKSFNLAGIEADRQLIDLGKKKYPHLNLISENLENLSSLPNSKLITLFHLLEHLSDPFSFLKNLREKVDESARLVIEVPVLDRAREIHGQDICGFFSIPHRSHFSRQTLRRMLSHTGWNVETDFNHQGNGYRVLVSPCMGKNESEDILDINAEKAKVLGYVQCRQDSIQNVQNILDQLPREGNVLIWGAGHHAEFLACLTSLFSENRRFIILDSDPLKLETFFHGIPIQSPSSLPRDFWAAGNFKVIISSFNWREAIYQELLSFGIDPSRIIKLYS